MIGQKLRTAMAARSNPDTFIIGRTDAYGALGLDAALRRAEGFLKLGVDGVFIAGLRTPEDYERVGRALNGAVLLGRDVRRLRHAVAGAGRAGAHGIPAGLLSRSP